MDATKIVMGLQGVLIVLMLLVGKSFGATICVDKSGAGGCWTTIQAGIDIATAGDTVLVKPGTYNEAISITKGVVLFGSGHTVTAIAYTDPVAKPAVKFSGASCGGAKVSRFRITSSTDNGILAEHSTGVVTVSNCFVCWCQYTGAYLAGNGTLILTNNLFAENSHHGAAGNHGNVWLYSNILYKNDQCGYSSQGWSWDNACWSFYNCYFDNDGGSKCGGADGTEGDIESTPNFVTYPTDLHFAGGSPCVDAGRPGFDYFDCDGTPNDMGVYGGPDAYCGPGPVVTELQLVPATVVRGETFNIQAKGATR